AARFQSWKARYDGNVALLRRDMTAEMSGFETSGFNLDKNEMERDLRTSFVVKGLVKSLGEGRLSVSIPKNWRGAVPKGSEFVFHYSVPAGRNTLVEHTVELSLPPGALVLRKQLEDDDAEKSIEYKLATSVSDIARWAFGAFSVFSLVGGFLLFCLGLVLPKGARAEKAAKPIAAPSPVASAPTVPASAWSAADAPTIVHAPNVATTPTMISPPVASYRLRIEGGSRSGQIVVLSPDKALTIGRTPDSDLSFPDEATLSRKQAEITPDGRGGWFLGNKSQHGTYVGSTRVDKEHTLIPGESIKLGNTKVIFEKA
ncbi:MAG TPA: FHA domain-containing protein, partial [Planctomycetota bacterium]|nr:FHA domain-containing protein [Planctomycetota bacterium]